MASPAVASSLVELESSSVSQSSKSSGYQGLLTQIIASSQNIQLQRDLSAFIDSILSDSLGIVLARPLLETYVQALRQVSDTSVTIESSKYTLQALEPRVVSFEDQDAQIREILAAAYQESEDYVEAAKALQGIRLESSQRKVTDEVKFRTWIRICRLYLEEDDTLNAESYLNRAKTLLYKIDDPELSLVFQLSQARIHDSRRKFLEASQAYHSVSLARALAEDERLIALSKAIICAVLAPAGPNRSRSLGKLYKDERTAQLDEHGILEKMFLDRTISPGEVTSFSDKLAPHQLAQTADGSTVLAKAVIEHNLLGASRLYSNLGTAELGLLLNLNAGKAEEYAARMVQQGRLAGYIDQIEGVIFFGEREAGQDSRAVAALPSVHGLLQWDRLVQGLVEDVERVSSLLHEQALIV